MTVDNYPRNPVVLWRYQLDRHMLDVMQTIKDEVLDDQLINTCKGLVEKNIAFASTIVFICNSREAKRHMLTLPPYVTDGGRWRQLIRNLARRAEADAIVTITLVASVEGQQCMTVVAETLLNRYGMVYPYDRVGQQVSWGDPLQMEPPDLYGDLLPTPAGMAQA
jgi:hypothetical protein